MSEVAKLMTFPRFCLNLIGTVRIRVQNRSTSTSILTNRSRCTLRYCYSKSSIKSLMSEQYNMMAGELRRKNSDVTHKSDIFVYKGDGSNGESRKFCYDALMEVVDLRYHNIEYISPEQIKEGSWTQTCCVIVFGGGYDLGFIKALGPQGTQLIREFVVQGGSYLGFCAGAYWACDYIDFDKGGPLQVCGERSLKFYPGKCIGPAFPGFGYKNKEGVRAVPVSYKGLVFSSYLHGGGYFLRPNVFSETNPDSGQQNLNVVSPESSEIKDNLHAQERAVHIVAAENDAKDKTESQNTRLIMPNVSLHTEAIPARLCDKANERLDKGEKNYEILGAFTTLSENPAAFIKCSVGRGKAILSGVHIEYPVEALDGHHPNVKPVMPALNKSEEVRDFVFRDILLQVSLKLKQARSLL